MIRNSEAQKTEQTCRKLPTVTHTVAYIIIIYSWNFHARLKHEE